MVTTLLLGKDTFDDRTSKVQFIDLFWFLTEAQGPRRDHHYHPHHRLKHQ